MYNTQTQQAAGSQPRRTTGTSTTTASDRMKAFVESVERVEQVVTELREHQKKGQPASGDKK